MDRHETPSLTGLFRAIRACSWSCPPPPANASHAKFPDRPLGTSSARLTTVLARMGRNQRGHKRKIDLSKQIQMRFVCDSFLSRREEPSFLRSKAKDNHTYTRTPIPSAPDRTGSNRWKKPTGPQVVYSRITVMEQSTAYHCWHFRFGPGCIDITEYGVLALSSKKWLRNHAESPVSLSVNLFTKKTMPNRK